ncbi:MAG: nucleotide sugar dehydrogenase [Gammaproteobacteria bacterium]
MLALEEARIGVIGVGYVGLPLAVAFGRRFPTIGFDISEQRVAELRIGRDSTREVPAGDLEQATQLTFSVDPEELKTCNVFVVTVPTPVDNALQPDLGALISAGETVARALSKGDVVIYESTVYPGATEEVSVPILEEHSGLTFNEDFVVGYSPERINPGDLVHRLESIVKVTSGSTPEAEDFVEALYSSIVPVGTHRASSIRVAEAAKVIENTQRDVNIALINELSMIFERLGIDSGEVLEAAGTKWNFLPFKPGLVGGHCIGVDPYYLTFKSQEIGYHPEMILAGRRINDNMGLYVSERVVRLMIQNKIQVVGSCVLVLGLTFKEDCPDLRNTRVIDVVKELEGFGAQVDVYDPLIEREDAMEICDVDPVENLEPGKYDAIVLAVAHEEFKAMDPAAIRALGRSDHILYDVKSVLPPDLVDGRL